MRRNGDRGLPGGDREILDRGYGFHRTGDRWLPDRWLGMPSQGPAPPAGLNDGDPVTTWPDSSGNGHDATQVGTKRPIFKKNILNGKPVVRCTAAGQSGLNLVVPIPNWAPISMFAVYKPAAPMGFGMALMTPDTWGIGHSTDGKLYSASSFYLINDSNPTANQSVFHVFSALHITNALANIFEDGTLHANGGAAGPVSNYSAIGYFPAATPTYGDCDFAEIIVYSGALAAMLKKLLLIPLIPALITPGGPLTPPEQEELEVEPMAAGDRANIEAYLGQKYGITVAGGTPVDPSTVLGMLAWWKADGGLT